MRKIPGTWLTTEDQRTVLANYIHRYTVDHIPKWVRTARKPYPVQFASDQDWLAHSLFAVDKPGQLSGRVHRCESNPTWPLNPELQKTSCASSEGSV